MKILSLNSLFGWRRLPAIEPSIAAIAAEASVLDAIVTEADATPAGNMADVCAADAEAVGGPAVETRRAETMAGISPR